MLGSCTTIRVQICFNSILPTRDATRKRRHEVMPGRKAGRKEEEEGKEWVEEEEEEA